MDGDVLETFAAAADTILPGSSAKGVHERVARLFDTAIPGFPLLVVGLLDAFASDIAPGKRFAELSEDERSEVFELMMKEEAADIQDVLDGLMLFTMGQNYTENHPGHEEIWKRIGYHGPSEGVADA